MPRDKRPVLSRKQELSPSQKATATCVNAQNPRCPKKPVFMMTLEGLSGETCCDTAGCKARATSILKERLLADADKPRFL